MGAGFRQLGCPPHAPHRLVAQRSLSFGKKTGLDAASAHGLARNRWNWSPILRQKPQRRQASIHLFLHSCLSWRIVCRRRGDASGLGTTSTAGRSWPACRPRTPLTYDLVFYRMKSAGQFASVGAGRSSPSSIARQAANGRRAHHKCSVDGCPCRMDFSRAASRLMASSGNATSMSFFL